MLANKIREVTGNPITNSLTFYQSNEYGFFANADELLRHTWTILPILR
jgi:hypothetical protein